MNVKKYIFKTFCFKSLCLFMRSSLWKTHMRYHINHRYEFLVTMLYTYLGCTYIVYSISSIVFKIRHLIRFNRGFMIRKYVQYVYWVVVIIIIIIVVISRWFYRGESRPEIQKLLRFQFYHIIIGGYLSRISRSRKITTAIYVAIRVFFSYRDFFVVTETVKCVILSSWQVDKK